MSASVAVCRDGVPGDLQGAGRWDAVGHPVKLVTIVKYPHECSHSF